MLTFGPLLLFIAPLLAPGKETEMLHQLLDDVFEARLEADPVLASERGFRRFDSRLPDLSEDARVAREAADARFLDRLNEIDVEGLGARERIDAELLRHELEDRAAAATFRLDAMPITQQQGIQLWLPQLPDRVPVAGDEQLAAYLDRLEAVPDHVGALIALLRAGLASGRTPPGVVLTAVPRQIQATSAEAFVTDPTQHPCFVPFRSLDPGHELLTRARRAISTRVVPAMRELEAFFADEYLPGARTSIGISAVEGGAALYANRLRHFTTLEQSAPEIHDLGEKEVARIRGEMLDVIRRTGFGRAEGEDDAALLRRFTETLRTDPRFVFQRKEVLLDAYRALCKRIDFELPRLFRELPRLTYGVREMPPYMGEAAPSAYYYEGSLKNGLAGAFVVNTHRLDMRPRYEMVPLALHEAVPGHHLQIAIAQELEHLHPWRQTLGYDAFVEGWALYAERLGLEMGGGPRGLYADPYDEFGRLSFEMWRALRLVVDTGIHAFGWTRERAIEMMLENSALTRINVESEVDRYIAWPGQATAYKLGELKIRELRAKAEASLGKLFDLRSFHKTVLGAGPIPLPILERRIDQWIQRVYDNG